MSARVGEPVAQMGRRIRHAFGLALCLGTLTQLASAADDPAGVEFFENKIRPILADNCYSCHSRQSARVKGGLLLDTREGVLKGGDSGPAIKPGNVEQSLLIKAVRYDGEKLRMPPKGKKLAAEKIAVIGRVGENGRAGSARFAGRCPSRGNDSGKGAFALGLPTDPRTGSSPCQG